MIVMNTPHFVDNNQGYKHALARLFWLRNITVTALLFLLVLVVLGLGIALKIMPILIVILVMACINAFVFWRLKQSWKVSKIELAVNLTLDTLLLAAVLYLAGGSTNPLVSLFIIPVALSAVFLPIGYIVWFVMLTVGLYTILMDFYISLPPLGSRFGGNFNLHLIGMYGNFIFSAIIIAIFIYTLARNGRRHEQGLAHAKEKLTRHQHVVETALLAANAAHEISTPLSTINMLAEELLMTESQQPQIVDDVTEIKKQVHFCKKRLEVLQQKTLLPENENDQVALKEGLIDTLDNWITSHPEINVEQDFQLKKCMNFAFLNNLKLTLVNLMDNAADASLKADQPRIKVSAKIDNTNLIIDVDDFGEGLTDYQLSLIGTRPYSSKQGGLGIGLLLSHTLLDQMGGHVLLNNRNTNDYPSGIRARITVPLVAVN